jgi:TolB-like protein/class 3 adenylate cyclase/tetratricopeptide (TPR) repeat protein
MAEERAQRRLAAILAADVVGYSRLMAEDEVGTLAVLKSRRRDVLAPLVAKHQGRIFKVTGDGVLIDFGSAVNAVQCAVDLQQEMAAANDGQPEDRGIVLRIGVNLGDVIVEGSDLYGDGVNIAARLEAVAEPGEILVSGTAYDNVHNKVRVGFEDLGAQTLKNIADPVRSYRIINAPAVAGPVGRVVADRPSIAVLPFDNMSQDPEQQYFSDGMVEEIITALSRLRWLFVIARNSSFAYRGRAVDVKRIGRELGVRYILEGSVRKAGNRVRITGQLIDSSTGMHLWADRFDGGLEDIFDLQDQVTASVVGAISPKLEQAEIERAKRKPTSSLDAYDYYLRGMAAAYLWTKEGNREAMQHFKRAIELDPGSASAYGMAARCYSQRKAGGWADGSAEEVADAARLARRAVELGKDDALALSTAGITLSYVVGDLDEGAAFIEQALALNPNLAWAWLFSGFANVWLGEPEIAIERVARAMRLSPQDFQFFNMQVATAGAHLIAGRYAEALSWAEAAVRAHPNYVLSNGIAAASAAHAGRVAEAEKSVARMRSFQPDLRIADLVKVFPVRRPEHRSAWIEGLRKAGLPD